MYRPIIRNQSKKDLNAAWWTNFSINYYDVDAGKKIRLKFYNYSDEAQNWNSWVLATSNLERGSSGYKEYFVLRNDAYGWGDCHNADGISHDFDWNTFTADMNGSLVDMTLSLGTDGVVKMESAIKTADNKVYNYSYNTTIPTKPGKIKVFFVNEKSYIDGTSISGVEEVISQDNGDNRIYNILGQPVDENYRGFVIINGKKVLRK